MLEGPQDSPLQQWDMSAEMINLLEDPPEDPMEDSRVWQDILGFPWLASGRHTGSMVL